MPDPLALMLDSMVFAVENGLSYDGIVSVPQIGLEDFGHRPGMAGWLDESAEVFRTTTEGISRLFRGTSQINVGLTYPDEGDSANDSEVDPTHKRSESDLVSPSESPAVQISHSDEENPGRKDEEEGSHSGLGGRLPRKLNQGDDDQAHPGSGARLPRRLDRQTLGDTDQEDEAPRPRETLPRKKSEQASEKLPRKQVGEKNRTSALATLPRKKVNHDRDSPSEDATQGLGDMSMPDVHPSTPMGSGSEDADRPLHK